MVNGDASPQQIKTAIFKEHGSRVELERISTLQRLWFESTGREAPVTRAKKGKAKGTKK
jgi:hypothetical protein